MSSVNLDKTDASSTSVNADAVTGVSRPEGGGIGKKDSVSGASTNQRKGRWADDVDDEDQFVPIKPAYVKSEQQASVKLERPVSTRQPVAVNGASGSKSANEYRQPQQKSPRGVVVPPAPSGRSSQRQDNATIPGVHSRTAAPSLRHQDPPVLQKSVVAEKVTESADTAHRVHVAKPEPVSVPSTSLKEISTMHERMVSKAEERRLEKLREEAELEAARKARCEAKLREMDLRKKSVTEGGTNTAVKIEVPVSSSPIVPTDNYEYKEKKEAFSQSRQQVRNKREGKLFEQGSGIGSTIGATTTAPIVAPSAPSTEPMPHHPTSLSAKAVEFVPMQAAGAMVPPSMMNHPPAWAATHQYNPYFGGPAPHQPATHFYGYPYFPAGGYPPTAAQYYGVPPPPPGNQ